jgi:hypothetical protein
VGELEEEEVEEAEVEEEELDEAVEDEDDALRGEWDLCARGVVAAELIRVVCAFVGDAVFVVSRCFWRYFCGVFGGMPALKFEIVSSSSIRDM